MLVISNPSDAILELKDELALSTVRQIKVFIEYKVKFNLIFCPHLKFLAVYCL